MRQILYITRNILTMTPVAENGEQSCFADTEGEFAELPMQLRRVYLERSRPDSRGLIRYHNGW